MTTLFRLTGNIQRNDPGTAASFIQFTVMRKVAPIWDIFFNLLGICLGNLRDICLSLCDSLGEE